MKKVNIVLICDDNFAFLTRICMKSIIANKKTTTNINFVVICVEVSLENKLLFKNLGRKDVVINIIEKNNMKLDIKQHRVSPAALNKFMIPEICKDMDKALYIDGDTIVNTDLTDLFNTDLKDKYAGMVIDHIAEIKQHDNERLNHNHYFNSGMILFNIKKCLKDKLPKKLFEWKLQDTFCRYQDQDAFNVVFDENVVILDNSYNFYNACFDLREYDARYNFLKSVNKINIIHYTGEKPTDSLDVPRINYFLKYLDLDDLKEYIKCIVGKNVNTTEQEIKSRLQDIGRNIETVQNQNNESQYLIRKHFKKKDFLRPFFKKSSTSVTFLLLWLPILRISYRDDHITCNILKHIRIFSKRDGQVKIFGIPVNKKTKPIDHDDVAPDIKSGEILSDSDMPHLDDTKINIGFLICGGLGDIVIALNYIWYFANKFKTENINIDLFIRNDINFVKCVLKELNFADRWFTTFRDGKYYDIRDEYSHKYDVYIRLVRMPEVLHYKTDKIDRNSMLINYLETLKSFKAKNNDVYKNDNIATQYSVVQGKNRIQQPDINGYLGIKDFYGYTVPVHINEYEFLNKYGLLGKKFVTVHNEVDFRLPPDSPKIWSNANYEELIAKLKTKYPDLIFVQIGNSTERSPKMAGIDVYPVGELSMEETKCLLKNAWLHIDIEGGFVHLHQALNSKGTAVVLFGPTNPVFYGYKNNINIFMNKCPCCENITSNWYRCCLRDDNRNICMKSITPNIVFERIVKYMDEHPDNPNRMQILNLKDAKKKGYQEIIFSLDGIGDTLLFRSAVEQYAQSLKKKVLIGAKRLDLFEDSEFVDILYGYNETSISDAKIAMLKKYGITPKFITGVDFIKDKKMPGGYARRWPKRHLITSLCSKLGMSKKVTLGGTINLTKKEQEYGRFYKNQIAIVAGGVMKYKTIPTEIIQDVVNKLSNKYNFVQIGDRHDPKIYGCIDKRGCSSIREVASILHNSDLFVSSISGLMHLSKFVGCKRVVVSTYGEPTDITKYTNTIYVAPKNPGCKKCSLYQAFPYQINCASDCIAGVSADDIISGIEQALQQSSDSKTEFAEMPDKTLSVVGMDEYIKKHGKINKDK